MSVSEKRYVIGIGCRRGVPKGEILAAIDSALKLAGIHKNEIAGAASCEIKNNEEGLLEAVNENSWDIVFYPAEELDKVKTNSISEYVKKHAGTGSVSEAAALLRSAEKKLMLPKTKFGSITIAIAR